ncbi:MAG: hypothetical protein DWH79_13240 [Planctomycetota bacterium]|nr:MAG: hypothetical protein DWH79_13240 [Planctomycetota bacterium]
MKTPFQWSQSTTSLQTCSLRTDWPRELRDYLFDHLFAIALCRPSPRNGNRRAIGRGIPQSRACSPPCRDTKHLPAAANLAAAFRQPPPPIANKTPENHPFHGES